jgi:S-(hydroxymethyl)glutathione dehydrogenase / alcohol dehydrogenase
MPIRRLRYLHDANPLRFRGLRVSDGYYAGSRFLPALLLQATHIHCARYLVAFHIEGTVRTMIAIGAAAVTRGDGTFTLERVAWQRPQANEVLIKICASGICHTDLDSISWGKNLILGHEGAGVVLACGEGVTGYRVDDRVLLNWAMPCGQCFQCRIGGENICEQKPTVPAERFRCGSISPLRPSFGLGTLAAYAVVPTQAMVKLGKTISFASACLLGCGVMTGFGSVVNVARVQPGQSVVVLGNGGVGLSVIQGAAYSQASQIIAVDINPSRLEQAERFGATHCILSTVDDLDLTAAAATVQEITGRGADFAFECTAVPRLGSAPLRMIRNGGTAVAVSGIEQTIPVDMELFEWDKIYINPLYGKCKPSIDFPLLLNLYQRKQLLLDEMITRRYPLSSLVEALDDMKYGRITKGVILFDD